MSVHTDFLEERIRGRVRDSADHLRKLADEIDQLATDRPVHILPGSFATALAWGFANAMPGEPARMLGDLIETKAAEEATSE